MKNGLSTLAKILVTTLILASSVASAGNINAVVNGKSYHFNSSHEWNEDNSGLGIEYEFTQTSAWKKIAMANAFRDSTNSMSYMAGAGLHRRIYETEALDGFYIYAGINAFLMTRDDVGGSKPFPGILPSVSLGNRKVGLNVTYLPRKAVEEMTDSFVVDPTLDGILFLQFKVNMDQLLP